MELQGKVALVTGAAHRVGRDIALGLAREGMHVVVHYNVSADAAQQTLADVRALGVDAIAVKADQSYTPDVDKLFTAATSRFGRLDVLVNSAAIMERKAFLDITEADWDRTLDINLKGPFLCAQAAARLMLPREQGGAIINIADLAGLKPWPSYLHHSVSKAGIVMMTKVLALALGPTIRVNAVAPGPVAKPVGWTDERWEAHGATLPLRRTGAGQDVAEAVVFLLKADYITGEVVVVDGGSSLV
jgi:NAD(P)-dependent dehydrogenase (short-subunit alcohol dehydrogenase family)